MATILIRATVLSAVLIASTRAPLGAQTFDHGPFDRLLQAYVDDAGLVDYDAFAADAGFDAYLSSLARAEPDRLSAPEQVALWINAYNAYTIELINRHEERESIRRINRAFGLIAGKGPWKERLARVGGQVYTLDEIEHEILRKRFHEPRIHFALVCAAVGCPPLRREAYTGAHLDRQLDDQARRFLLSSPSKNRVDVANRRVFLSPIFDWYGSDFGEDRAAVAAHLARYFPPGPARDLLQSADFELRFTDYDWSLNVQR